MDLGPDAAVVASDASNVAAQKELAEVVLQRFGGLDVLFVNAGVVDMRPMEQIDEAAFDRSLAINLKGPFFRTGASAPVRKPSIHCDQRFRECSYRHAEHHRLCSNQGGPALAAKTISGELIGRGIRVNAVSPGPITTPLYGKLGFSETELKQVAASIQGQVPAKRFGTPTEIANAVVYLASDESAFTVGSDLMIDGGMGTL